MVDATLVDSNCVLTPQGGFVLCVWNMANVILRVQGRLAHCKKKKKKERSLQQLKFAKFAEQDFCKSQQQQ
jgi:hypothetical protein